MIKLTVQPVKLSWHSTDSTALLHPWVKTCVCGWCEWVSTDNLARVCSPRSDIAWLSCCRVNTLAISAPLGQKFNYPKK